MTHPPETKLIRSFGLIVGGICLLIGLWPLAVRAEPLGLWAVGTAAGLLLPAVLFPKVLTPIYRVWMTIGEALGWINTRIVLSLIFYVLFTPFGVVRRVLLKKDPLQLAFEPEAETYRIIRQPRPHSHIERQF